MAVGADRAESASHSPVRGQRAPKTANTAPKASPFTSEPVRDALGRFEVWFPVRLGPPRKKTKYVAGVRISARERNLELPPSSNDPLHRRDKGPWTKSWRQESAAKMKAQQLPACERVRISAIVYRDRLGMADEDNDRSRLKPLVDGLRDAKVIAKDTRGYVEYGSCDEERAGTFGPGILLIVEPLVFAAREQM